jgi:phage baseplate assembly protein W|tara:strand:+ start:215 stop:622 length:408 start_codon:yes stop_codon:yes gene_type:complete
MAFGAIKIFPIDTKPDIAVGVSIPFNAPAVFFQTYITADALKNNMLNFFLTNNGERYMNPMFGGNIRNFVFEQMSQGTIETFKSKIQSQLTIYFPSVVVENLEVLSNEDNQTIMVQLTYSVRNTGIYDNLEIQFT